MYSGRGGTETFTAGQVRELALMGIDSRVITVGLGEDNSKPYFPDIEFYDVDTIDDLAHLDDILIFIDVPHDVVTRNKSYVIFHTPPLPDPKYRTIYKNAVQDKIVVTISHFMQRLWAEYLGLPEPAVEIVHPFADPHFSEIVRPEDTRLEISVLYAGRLRPEKGIYHFLECMHHDILEDGYTFTVTKAGNQTLDGKIIETFLESHPGINLVEACHTPQQMAELLAQHDVIVMPSTHNYWHEGFGMLSVEAQHAGCRVVASDDGGLPETNCGGLTLFEADNSFALAEAISSAASSGPVSDIERKKRTKFFTRRQSAQSLLDLVNR